MLTIPGTRSVARLEQNAAAADLTLTTAEHEELDELAPAGAFVGDRYPEAGMRSVNG